MKDHLIEDIRKAKMIPFRGELVTWEFYADHHGIKEYGFYGDIFNSNNPVYVPKYEEYLRRALPQFIHSLLKT
jgi:hypothetical protein